MKQVFEFVLDAVLTVWGIFGCVVVIGAITASVMIWRGDLHAVIEGKEEI